MKPHKLLLWSARVAGLLMAIFFLMQYLGAGSGNIFPPNGKQLLPFIPFTLLTFAAFTLAWFKPFPGGIVLMGASVLIAIFFVCIDNLSLAVMFGLPALLIGLCFVAAADKELI